MMKAASKTPLTIIQALRSKALFAGLFDAPSWKPWLVFLRALFALPLDREALALYQHHTGRQTAPEKAFKEACLVCGRRGGKSRILALIGVYLAAVIDWSRYLAPGEIPVIAVIAADRRQAKVILSYMSGLLHAAPGLKGMIAGELAENITLTNSVSIEIHTASIGAPRGRTYVAILADEIAFWTTDAGAANPDREIIAAVRPGLSTLPGSLLLLASSPYAKRGTLYENFSRYFGKDDAPVLVWRGTTREMNSALDPRVIEEAYSADPESAAAEYGAEFRGDVAEFLDRELVESLVDAGVTARPPQPGLDYVAHVDASGGRGDSFAAAISHLEDEIAVLDCIFERRAPFDPAEVMDEVAALLRSYRVNRCSGDNFGANWVSEAFARRGIRYEVSERKRSAIYLDLLPLLTSGRARLIQHQRLIHQLCALERRTMRSGRDEVNHPAGGADDLAVAAAGALVMASTEAAPSLIPRAALEPAAEAEDLGYVTGVFATLWLRFDGLAGWALFALSVSEQAPLTLLDADETPWSANLLGEIARRLDEIAEGARERNFHSRERGVSAWFFTPDQFASAAQAAMRRAFEPRLSRIDAPFRTIGADAIEYQYVADPVRLQFDASAKFSEGRVRISPQAGARGKSSPLLGAMSARWGERIDDDPLRMAVILGAALGLPSGETFEPPVWAGARLR